MRQQRAERGVQQRLAAAERDPLRAGRDGLFDQATDQVGVQARRFAAVARDAAMATAQVARFGEVEVQAPGRPLRFAGPFSCT